MRLSGFIAGALLALAGGAALAQPAGAPLTPTLVPTTAPRAATTGSPALPPRQAGRHELTKADVDTWLDGFMPHALSRGGIAGAVVMVVKDGQVLTGRGYGYSDVAARKPVDPNQTLFRPGSVSKLITWTAVMQQVEAGKIDLDADINRYIDFKVGPKDGKPVTMRQLMTHTGGFEETAKNIIFFDPSHNMSIEAYLKAAPPRLAFTPGSTPAYSNWATTLAAYVVQRVTKQPFDDYIEQRIFRPLGMTTATFRQPLPAQLAPLMSKGYQNAAKPAEKWEYVGPSAAGSMSASGADMAKFMLAHLNGGELNGQRILSAETARQMHTSATDMLPMLNRMMLGFFETNINGREVIAHLGDTTQFHSALHLFLNEGVGLYLSVNSTGRDGAAGAVRSALFEEFADRYFPGPSPSGKVDAATAKAHAAAMAGHWEASRRFDSSFMTLSRLLGQTAVSVNDKGQLVVPSLRGPGGEPRQWVEIAPWVWRDPMGHELLSAKVVDGKPVRFSVSFASPFMVFDRAPISRSAAWLLPALYGTMAVLVLTVLLWPVRYFVRRHYGQTLLLERRALLAHRLSRAAALVILLTFVGWGILITVMSSNLANLSGRMDVWAWILQGVSLIAFVGGAAVLAWNAWIVWTTRQRWPAKVWSVLLLLAGLIALWIAIAFKLFAFTVQY